MASGKAGFLKSLCAVSCLLLIASSAYSAMLDHSSSPSQAAGLLYSEARPSWAPPEGHQAQYKYQYFPEAQVYYEPMREVFFYQVKGQWIKSPSLPRELRSQLGDFVVLDMDTDHPFVFHSEVIALYPPRVSAGYAGARPEPVGISPSDAAGFYRYDYYPAQQVYFDPARNLFYFLADGKWTNTYELPPYLANSLGDFVVIEMDTDTPYLYDPEVKQMVMSQSHSAAPKIVGRPPWESQDYRIAHRYEYYPAAFVYFDMDRKVYFYRSDGQWIESPSLPDHILTHLANPIILHMNTSQPYVYHEEVMERYPHPGAATNRSRAIFRIYKVKPEQKQ